MAHIKWRQSRKSFLGAGCNKKMAPYLLAARYGAIIARITLVVRLPRGTRAQAPVRGHIQAPRPFCL